MLKLRHQNIAGSMITVTTTSTLWSDLVNTAAGTALRNAGFDTNKANGINLIPLDGSIRFQEDGNDPTATEGEPLDQNYIYGGRNIGIENLRLISSTGGNVLCYIQPGMCNPHETTFISPAGASSGGNSLISTGATYSTVSMASADTEYTYTLTSDVKSLEMRLDIDSSSDFKLNIGGGVGDSATDYIPVEDGELYWRQNMNLASGTVLRFQSPTAGQTMKIVTYS